MKKKRIESACARYDKNGNVIRLAEAKIAWAKKRMGELGLDPESHEDRAFFKEINS